MNDQFPVLLLDDDPSVAEMITRAAQSQFPEARIIHAFSIAQASAHIENLVDEDIRLILLDIDLKSSQTGLDFLELTRAHAKARIIPVIMLTALDDDQVVERAYKLGAVAFTHKPFEYSQWKEYVSTLRTYWFDTVVIPRPSQDPKPYTWLYRHKD